LLYIQLVNNKNNVNKGTTMIKIIKWMPIHYLYIVLSLCMSFYITPLSAAQVNLLNSSSATAIGTGASGIPAINNFTIPAGKNRVLFVWTGAERDHCSSTDDCTGGNATGTGLGDNWPMPLSLVQLTARVTGSGGSVDKKNALGFGANPSGDLWYHYLALYPQTLGAAKSFFTLSALPIALYESEISQALGGGSQWFSNDYPTRYAITN
jgi:hypothetical protein